MPLVTTEEARGIIGFEGELDMDKVFTIKIEEPDEPDDGAVSGETREEREARIKEEKQDE
jgi:hypothetical protein